MNKKILVISVAFIVFLTVVAFIIAGLVIDQASKDKKNVQQDKEQAKKKIEIQNESLTGHLKRSSDKILACSMPEKYKEEDEKVYYNEVMIEEADFDSFEIIGEGFEGYAKDKNHLYSCGLIVEGVEPEDFEYFGYYYSRINDKIYYKNDLVEQADTETFRAVYEYSGNFIDKNYGYGFDNEVLLLDDFWFIHYDQGGTDLGENYRKYKERIYYWEDGGGQAVSSMVFIDADHSTFETINNAHCKWDREEYRYEICRRYGKDKNKVFIDYYEIESADPQTFKILQFDYAKDINSVFHESYKLEGADPDSLEIISSSYSKDNTKVFYWENEIVEADSGTFVVLELEGQIAKDANSFYWRNEKLELDDYERFGINAWILD